MFISALPSNHKWEYKDVNVTTPISQVVWNVPNNNQWNPTTEKIYHMIAATPIIFTGSIDLLLLYPIKFVCSSIANLGISFHNLRCTQPSDKIEQAKDFIQKTNDFSKSLVPNKTLRLAVFTAATALSFVAAYRIVPKTVIGKSLKHIINVDSESLIFKAIAGSINIIFDSDIHYVYKLTGLGLAIGAVTNTYKLYKYIESQIINIDGSNKKEVQKKVEKPNKS